MSGRPVVILAGWLGCQPRWLRRYEVLYQKMGFDVLSYIAKPRLVVDSTIRSRPIQVPDGWPTHLSEEAESMDQLAWHLLGRVHNKQSAVFLYHAFSNGGCFLWESTRRILDYHNDNPSCQQPAQDILKHLRRRLKGVVFDSCPAWFGGSPSGLSSALQYCTPLEKLDVLARYGPGVLFHEGESERQQMSRRCHDFFHFLHNDPLDIPQLFIYSKNDPLADSQKIRELYQHRLSTKNGPILETKWDESAHCAHLRMHPKDYLDAIEFLTEVVLLRSKL